MIRGHFGVELVASRSQPAINEDGRRQVVDHLWAGGEREPSACLPCPLMRSQQLTMALPPSATNPPRPDCSPARVAADNGSASGAAGRRCWSWTPSHGKSTISLPLEINQGL